jgi:hypothetical protein
MEDYVVRLVVPSIALVSGLIATYVSLQNRALLAEVRKEMADLENRLIARINGTYIRRRECELIEQNMHERVESLAQRFRERESAGD